MAEQVVVDASAMVDLLIGSASATAVAAALDGKEVHAPAHVDLEVLSALGRLHRAGHRDAGTVESDLAYLQSAPIERHQVLGLLEDAWQRRGNLRLSDGVYVALAERLSSHLVSTDQRLCRAQPDLVRSPTDMSEQ